MMTLEDFKAARSVLSGVIAAETKHYLKHLDEKDESEIPVVDR